MKNVRKMSKKYYLRQIIACWLAFYMFFGMPVQIAVADPSPGENAVPKIVDVISSSGLAAIDPFEEGTNRLDIKQADSVAIINWHNFDIGLKSTVNFDQADGGGVTAAVLNRIHDGDITGIMGKLLADGRVFIINPAGIIFGENAQINVAQLTASSLDILDSDFLNGLPYEFDAGIAVGDITNYGEITASDGLVALMGRNIVNEGIISAEGGYVIMAAGDRVLLSENDGLVVEVEMDTLPENRTIHNDDDENLSNTDHVILAAGDIWSAAIEGVETLRAEAKGDAVFDGHISVYAGAGSDAEADVTIITGGDLDIEDDIEAVAIGDGVGGFDAYASVTIEAAGDIEIVSDGKSTTEIKAVAKDGLHNYADISITSTGGDVEVLAQNGDVKIKAEADPTEDFDPVLNVANIEITGENVNIQSEDNGLGDDYAFIHAFAHDGKENRANVQITATGTEIIEEDVVVGISGGDVLIESEEGLLSDDAIVKAEAKNGEDNLATVGISAADDVEVKAYGFIDDDVALVKAEAWNDIELAPEIPPDFVIESVLVKDAVYDGDTLIKPAVYEDVEVPQEAIVDLAVEGLTNTAAVDITADNGNVVISGEGNGDASVEALAHNNITVDIENSDNEVTVNLTVQNLENNASVTIDADGEEINVNANGMNSKAGVFAEAYNELQVDQHTGNWVWDGWFHGHWENGFAAELNLDVQNITNNAGIGITADGWVTVGSEEFWTGAEALVEAASYNDFIIDLYTEEESVTPTVALTLDGLTNNSAIDVAAVGDVKVHAQDGGEAGIAAYTSNFLEADDEENIEGTLLVDNINNDSGVAVDAGEDVIVMAECFSNDSDAYIVADAWNEVAEPDEDPAIAENTATVEVAAGEDVKVMAFDGGDAEIAAYTYLGVLNTSGVTVNTADGDVLVLAKEGSDARILAEAMEGDDNVANVVVNAVGGDVKVIAKGGEWVYNWCQPPEWEPSSATIEALAKETWNSNTADVHISATATTSECEEEVEGGEILTYVDVDGGDVKVIAKEGGEAGILATAVDADPDIEMIPIEGEEGYELEFNPTSNTANVTIRTTSAEGVDYDIVELPASPSEESPSEEQIEYVAVTYTEGGNVEVKAEGGHAGIVAEAVDAVDNTAGVDIDADGNVLVMDEGGEGSVDTAEIAAYAEEAYNSNTANVMINADNVAAIATNNGTARIKAQASGIMGMPSVQLASDEMYIPEPDGTKNNASVEIHTNASEEFDSDLYECLDEMLGDYENPQLDAFLEGLFQGGHVLVAGLDGDAHIMAYAEGGTEGTANMSDVLVCADGGVLVGALNSDSEYSSAEIKALSSSECISAYSNTANLGIGAELGLGVLAAGSNAYASIASEAVDGYINQADLVACTDGIAAVLGIFGGSAEIASRAIEGTFGSAYTGVCAGEDVLVAALEGDAYISSEAEGSWLDREKPIPDTPPTGGGDTVLLQQEMQEMPEIPDDPSTANATTVVYSKRGVVAVVDYDSMKPTSAGITSDASNAEINTALTGVVAGSDLTVGQVFSDDPPTTLLSSLLYDLSEMYEFDVSEYFTPGSVYVMGLGSNGHATILSEATNGLANNAETVVASPGEVVVIADELYSEGMPIAQIKSRAGWHGDSEAFNTAKTRIYASDVYVDVPDLYRGNAIWAYAAGVEGNPRIPGTLALDKGILTNPYTGETYSLTEHGEVVWTEENEETGSSATLIIQDYSKAVDLPDCPDCPCEEEAAVKLAAPLDVVQAPQIAGCPAAMEAVANELAIGGGTLQISIGGMLALNPSIQPCNACAGLLNAAAILRDEDGSRMAALNQVFNEVAPANVPFSPVMATSIVTAFADQVDDGSQSNYATAMEYIDAFVQYVAILDTQLGSPVEDSTAFVMAKYGSGITENENSNVAAFVAARLAGLESF